MYKYLNIFLILFIFILSAFGQKSLNNIEKIGALNLSQLEGFLKKSISENDSLSIAHAYKTLANIKRNDPSLRFQAVELSLKSIDFFQNHDEEQRNWEKLFLANLFNESNDSKLSLEYANVLADSVLEFSNKIRDLKLKMSALQVIYRIGAVVKNKKVSREKSLSICDSLVHKFLVTDIGLLKMHYYFKATYDMDKNPVKSDSLFKICRKYAMMQHDSLITAHTYLHASYICRSQKKYQKAINLIQNNISETTLQNYPDLAKWVYQELAQDYALIKNAKLSNQYWELYFGKANEISAQNFKKYNLSELIDGYLSKKQLLENEKLQQTNLSNITTVKKYKNLLIFLPIVFLLAGAFLFSRSKWNNLLNDRLKIEILLEGQELERNRLSKELHDGVGSSIAALKTNLYIKEKSTENKQLLILLDDLYLKVRDISHQVYPSFLITDGLIVALDDYIRIINTDKKIIFTFFGKEPEIEAVTLLNIFRIIQELLNNAVKHAGSSKIEVEILFKKEEIFVRVQDNGRGFDQNKDFLGIGLKNIKNRIDFIKGQFECISEPESGTTFLITIQHG